MDTRLVTNNIRTQQWMTVFSEKAESGLTVAEFCEQKGISKNMYYYWLKKARRTMIEQGESRFAELEVIPGIRACSSFATQLTIEKNGNIISINNDTPKELLAMALEVASDVK